MDMLEARVSIFGRVSFLPNYVFADHRSGVGSKIERTTRVDLNNDGVIGRPLDTMPGGYAGPN